MNRKQKEDIVKNMVKVIEDVKKNPNSLIEEHFINPIVDVKNGETVAVCVDIWLNKGCSVRGRFLDALVRKMKTEDYFIWVELGQIVIRFRVEEER